MQFRYIDLQHLKYVLLIRKKESDRFLFNITCYIECIYMMKNFDIYVISSQYAKQNKTKQKQTEIINLKKKLIELKVILYHGIK